MSKTVLITGGSRGIGAATAAYFSKKGYKVALTFNKEEALAEKTAELIRTGSNDAAAFRCDVSNSNDVKNLVEQVMDYFGNIDVLVNNAGIAQQKMITNITDEDWHKMIEVNLSGTFYCSREITPIMVHNKAGSIINISSMWGVCGASCEVHYSAAKAGIIGFTKALAKELGPSNIRVNCIAPGVIDTDMNKFIDSETMKCLAEETPLQRIGTAEEVAEAIYFLAENGTFITGQILGTNGGFVI